MDAATPTLNRLIRRWWGRLCRTSLAEAFCCAGLGAAGATLTVLLLTIGSALPAGGPRWIAAAAPLAALAACVLPGPIRRALSRTAWTFLLALALGWASAWWTVPRFYAVWTQSGQVGGGLRFVSVAATVVNEAALAFAAALLAVIVRLAPVRRDRHVSAWLDERIGGRLLLATAAELAARGPALSPVERAVVERAESLAGQDERFVGVSPRRLDERWWGLLGLLLAGVLLVGWIIGAARPEPAGVAGPGRAGATEGRSASARQESADQLYQIAMAADSAGESGLADSARAAAATLSQGRDPASAREAIEQARADAAARAAAAVPMLQALAQLAAQPAGTPIAAVLAYPAQPPDRAVAAAREQADAWRAAELSQVDRTRLADQLRQAARQVGAGDPELADRLNRTADALAAGDWQTVSDQLGAIVRRIHPIARGHLLAESAVRAMDGALATASNGRPAGPATVALAPAPPAGLAADGGPAAAPDDPRWHAAREQARQELQTQSLTAEQQQAVRRYFGLGE